MNFPLEYQFKVIALANQIYIRDSGGQDLLYVKQKMFKLKENVEIYRDSSKADLLYRLKADRVIDFSPKLTLYDANDRVLGSVKRHGRRSIWKAEYELELGDKPFAKVKEMNPWAKVGDTFFGEIPILGLISGYLFHPKYRVSDLQDQDIAHIKKLPAFLEGKYTLDAVSLQKLPENEQEIAATLLMTVILFERMRG